VTIAALITTIARLFVRLRMIRNVGWDVSSPKDENERSTDSFFKDYIMTTTMLLVSQDREINPGNRHSYLYSAWLVKAS
jgi:hypothetical protein